MSAGTQYTQQSYKVSDSFPFKWINKKWREGFHVTSMATAGSRWGVVMSRNAGFSDQVGLYYMSYFPHFPLWFSERSNLSWSCTGLPGPPILSKSHLISWPLKTTNFFFHIYGFSSHWLLLVFMKFAIVLFLLGVDKWWFFISVNS